MAVFTINEEKCTRCNICATACPAQVIRNADKDNLPMPTKNFDLGCIGCGHCVTVCPTQAFSLEQMSPSDCPCIENDQLPTGKNIAELLKSRRSIRHFTDKPIGKDTLTELFEVARYSPTACNQQQCHWSVYQDAGDIANIASKVAGWAGEFAKQIPDPSMAKRLTGVAECWKKGRDVILYNAPVVIVVHSNSQLASTITDCHIALTYLELYAASMGLGTCWAGFLTGAANNSQVVLDSLKLPEGHTCYGAVMLGYPKYDYKQIPKRQPTKVTWH